MEPEGSLPHSQASAPYFPLTCLDGYKVVEPAVDKLVNRGKN